MLTIQHLLRTASQQLQAVTETPALEAEVLLAHVLEKPRSYLHAWPTHSLTPNEQNCFIHLLERRLKLEPIAYLTGSREFWSLKLTVTKDTLIPRPETEILVEAALNLGDKASVLKIADLGTGSGAIALALAHERPNWQIVAVDISENALVIASNNAQQLGLGNISFSQGSWCTALPQGEFDVIISNPPYIAENEWEVYANQLAFEPRGALVSGIDGLDALSDIIKTAANCLKPDGYIILEHGFSQGKAVHDLMVQAGFYSISLLYDGAHLERATIGRRGLVSLPELDYN